MVYSYPNEEVIFLLRTHTCGELRKADVGKKVKLCGWVHRIRDLGGIKFVVLRDRYGQTQVVVSPDSPYYETVEGLKREYVVLVEGTVRERPKDAVNPSLPTGEIEVEVSRIEILSEAKDLPFYPDESPSNEELRLRYRYIDLRRERMKRNILLRHEIVKTVRNYLDNQGFVEIETPNLTKSTPEGARDFLVPSRLKPGRFYALPQSPQLFKQILMVSGFDKYYQIARCFRDEDLRADRQPEFTQIDIEMSFVEREDVLNLVEGMIKEVFEKVLNVDVEVPFDRLTYEEAMERFGSDKPDRRYGMELQDLTDYFKGTDFSLIKRTLDRGGVVKGFVVENFARKMSRRVGEEFGEFVKKFGLGGIMWFKLENGVTSPMKKHLGGIFEKIAEGLKMNEGDVLLFSFGEDRDPLNEGLGNLRLKIGKEHFPEKAQGFDILWIVDFPFFEWSDEEKRFVARHHPFTMPVLEDIERYKDEPEKIRALSYDIVVNGYELGGGSIRIHNRRIQEKIFEMLGISKEEALEKFGFLLEAFEYGAPPHGGIALGLDRFVAILAGEESIRDVIAFPKTGSGVCLMTGAPSEVRDTQLKELKIKLVEEVPNDE